MHARVEVISNERFLWIVADEMDLSLFPLDVEQFLIRTRFHMDDPCALRIALRRRADRLLHGLEITRTVGGNDSINARLVSRAGRGLSAERFRNADKEQQDEESYYLSHRKVFKCRRAWPRWVACGPPASLGRARRRWSARRRQGSRSVQHRGFRQQELRGKQRIRIWLWRK